MQQFKQQYHPCNTLQHRKQQKNLYINHMSSFLVRRVSQHNININSYPNPSTNPSIKQKQQNKLKIQPNSITFDYQQNISTSITKVSISKLLLTNISNNRIEYQIKQPNQQYFKVKYSKNQLNSGESMQVYVFFNMDMCISNLIDQFVIIVGMGKVCNIVVPISIKVAEQSRSRKVSRSRTLKKQGKTKQNINMLRIKHNKVHDDKKSELKLNILRLKSVKIQQPSQLSKIQQIEDYSLLARIQKFEKQYNRVVAFLKDKAIKNQIYKGKKQISKQRYNQIIDYNKKIEEIINQMNKQKILTRYKNNNNKNGPSVRTFQNIKMQWNKNRNMPRITFKKGIQKLYRQVRNIVIFHRFRKMNKVLSIYRNLREQENIEQPQTKIINNKIQISAEQISLQSQIWQEDSEDREYQIQIQEKKKHDYYCRKISKMITNKKQRNLGADFTQFTLSPRLLPMDYQEPQAKKHHVFEIKPRIGFDNWVSLEQSTMYNHQLMKYHKTDRIPQWECHPYCQDNVKTKSKVIKIAQKSQRPRQDTINIRHGHKKLTQKLLTQLKIQKQPPPLISPTSSPTSLASPNKHLHKQFKQCCFQPINQYQHQFYKNYLPTPYQLQLLNKQQQLNAQLDIFKPNRNNIRDLGQIKYCKQQYISYFVSPIQSMMDRFININNDELIYEIKKQDIIDFDQPTQLIMHKIDYIQSIQCRNSTKSLYSKHSANTNTNIMHNNNNNNRGRLHNAISLNQCNNNNINNNFNNMEEYNNKDKESLRDWRNQNQQSQQYMYEKIIDNLKKTQIREYSIAQSKIASFNQFIKRNQNKIYY